MKIYIKILFIIFLFSSIISSTAKAVEPKWKIGFKTIFDNREGNSRVTEAKTFFFTSFAPEIGLKFSAADFIYGGAVWNQPLENQVKNSKIIPTLYYRHDGRIWKFSFGMFPRTQLRQEMPGFLWCDSMAYFQPNIRGAMVQYFRPDVFFESYIDWRGIQSETTREAFNIVFHGEYNKKSLLYGVYAKMNHLATTRRPEQPQFVVDNFLFNPYLGYNSNKATILDTLVIKTGAILGMDRNRENNKWKVPYGFWLDLMGEWKFLGIKNSLYLGKKLFSLHNQFGNILYQGEPYFKNSFYDRLDIYAKIFSKNNVDLQAQLNFNFTNSGLMFYQRLMLSILIGN